MTADQIVVISYVVGVVTWVAIALIWLTVCEVDLEDLFMLGLANFMAALFWPIATALVIVFGPFVLIGRVVRRGLRR